MSFKHCDTLNPPLSSFLDWKPCSQFTYISYIALHMSYIPWIIKLVTDLRFSGPINELGPLRCVNVTWRYRFIVTYSHTQTHSNPKKKVKKKFDTIFFLHQTQSPMERAQDPENAVIHKQFEEACSDFQVWRKRIYRTIGKIY